MLVHFQVLQRNCIDSQCSNELWWLCIYPFVVCMSCYRQARLFFCLWTFLTHLHWYVERVLCTFWWALSCHHYLCLFYIWIYLYAYPCSCILLQYLCNHYMFLSCLWYCSFAHAFLRHQILYDLFLPLLTLSGPFWPWLFWPRISLTHWWHCSSFWLQLAFNYLSHHIIIHAVYKFFFKSCLFIYNHIHLPLCWGNLSTLQFFFFVIFLC